MEILTSYYAKVGKLISKGVVPVRISLGTPRWLNPMPTVKSLAPTSSIFEQIKLTGDTKEYTKSFRDYLATLDINIILDDLASISNNNSGAPIALCCYEKPLQFCHRHIVADWLNSSTSIFLPDVIEFDYMT